MTRNEKAVLRTAHHNAQAYQDRLWRAYLDSTNGSEEYVKNLQVRINEAAKLLDMFRAWS